MSDNAARRATTNLRDKMEKPKVGQIIYSLNVGNAARRCEQVLTPLVVCKVGTKYFYLAFQDGGFLRNSFHIDTWRENTTYSGSHKLYEKKETYEIEAETKALYEDIKPHFDSYAGWNKKGALPVESLRKIKEIILSDKQD